ncbi:MAG: hypothetical protein JWL59_3258 [Chthoniobacteraceae bacterium]|nr:hypothetical protein [Chthoniobacteraceae bacterium]
MNEFDRRWKMGIAARDDAGQAPESAPFGFATRVVADWLEMARAEPSFATLWQALAVRLLGMLTMLLAVLVAYDALTSPRPTLLQPEIENAVADAVCFL